MPQLIVFEGDCFFTGGQKREVKIDMITTTGEERVLKNLERKSLAAEKMFDKLVGFMNNSINISNGNNFTKKEEVPSWL